MQLHTKYYRILNTLYIVAVFNTKEFNKSFNLHIPRMFKQNICVNSFHLLVIRFNSCILSCNLCIPVVVLIEC